MILITGANGFIGSALIWQFNQANISNIIAVDTIDLSIYNLLKSSNYNTFIHTDKLFTYLETPDAIEKIEWVIHLGACSSTTETNWDYLYYNNYQYSVTLFEWCTKYKKKIIYASSAATYGNGEHGFSENISLKQLQPLNLYGKSKIMMDQWVLEQDNTPECWYGLRFFNVFGPNEYKKGNMASVAFKAYHQIKENHTLGLFKSYNLLYKDGEQKRDFIYIKDVVRWIKELIDIKPMNGIYNMGYGIAKTWLDMANSLFNSISLPISIQWLDMPDSIKNQYQYFTQADMSKWQQAGLSLPQWNLDEAIQDYVTLYLKKNNLPL